MMLEENHILVKDLIENIDNEFNEKILFYKAPKLSYLISKYRKRGIPKAYREVSEKDPIVDNMIFFESALGKQVRGHPKFLYEYIRRHYPDFKIVWCYNSDENIPFDDNVTIVKRGTKEYYRYLALSKFAINDTTFPIWSLREETIFLQTWHGTPLKRLHFDREDALKKKKVEPIFYHKSKSWTYLISPNKHSSDIFRTAFDYNGPILETGYPANDIFFNEKLMSKAQEKMYDALGVPEGNTKKFILYAPTWRDNKHTGNYKFDFELTFDIEKLMEVLDDDVYLLLRMHHMSNVPDSFSSRVSRVIDVSTYDDVHELMTITDLLITDYSSIMFDFLGRKKPMLLYAPDISDYSKYRGIYFDIEHDFPFPICRDENSLKEEVNKLVNTPITIDSKYRAFYDKYAGLETGNSCKKVCNFLFN